MPLSKEQMIAFQELVQADAQLEAEWLSKIQGAKEVMLAWDIEEEAMKEFELEIIESINATREDKK